MHNYTKHKTTKHARQSLAGIPSGLAINSRYVHCPDSGTAEFNFGKYSFILTTGKPINQYRCYIWQISRNYFALIGVKVAFSQICSKNYTF